jgi:hypothetical protein
MFQSILVAVDGSPDASAALAQAPVLIVHADAEVHPKPPAIESIGSRAARCEGVVVNAAV